MIRVCGTIAVVIVALAASDAAAQTFEAGAQVATVSVGQFDATDVGIGGRVSWHGVPLTGIEAEVTFFPEDLESGVRRSFTAGRTEGLFGVTIGPTLGRVRPFGRVRPGFVSYQEAPGPLICLAIFPPTLECQLAAGDTLFAVDVGGGIEVFPSRGTFIRFDLGDRAVRYPGQVFDLQFRRRDDPFFAHEFRFAVGGGVRF